MKWPHKLEIRPAMSASQELGQQRRAGRPLTTILTAATLLLTASLMAQPPRARAYSDSARSPFPPTQPLSLFKSFTTTSRMGDRLVIFRRGSASTTQRAKILLAGPLTPAMAMQTSLYAQMTMARPIRNQVLRGRWMMSTASEQTALPPLALSPPTPTPASLFQPSSFRLLSLRIIERERVGRRWKFPTFLPDVPARVGQSLKLPTFPTALGLAGQNSNCQISINRHGLVGQSLKSRFLADRRELAGPNLKFPTSLFLYYYSSVHLFI